MASEEQLVSDSLDILATDAVSCARRLIGSSLIADVEDNKIKLKIVETEAYDQSDAASHSYNGKTPRTDVMFGPAGHLYVYFTYGMHYCCNVVVGDEGYGAAVLIRAAEPLETVPLMSTRRGGRKGVELMNGPAKLCQALDITSSMNGHDLRKPPLMLQIEQSLPESQVVRARRVGISRAKDNLWRFYIKDNPFVSVYNTSK